MNIPLGIFLSPSINLVSDISSRHTLSILHQNIKCWGSMVETWLKHPLPLLIFFVSVSITYTPLSFPVWCGGSLGWVGLVFGGPPPPLVRVGCAPWCHAGRQSPTSEGGYTNKPLLVFCVPHSKVGAQAERLWGPTPHWKISISESTILDVQRAHFDPANPVSASAKHLPEDKLAGGWAEIHTSTPAEVFASGKPRAHEWSIRSYWPDIHVMPGGGASTVCNDPGASASRV